MKSHLYPAIERWAGRFSGQRVELLKGLTIDTTDSSVIKPLSPIIARCRRRDNLASVYSLYNRTGEKFLLDVATKIDRVTANRRQAGAGKLPNRQGVSAGLMVQRRLRREVDRFK